MTNLGDIEKHVLLCHVPEIARPTYNWEKEGVSIEGRAPTDADVARRCEALKPQYGPGCRFLPDYRPAPLSARSPARN